MSCTLMERINLDPCRSVIIMFSSRLEMKINFTIYLNLITVSELHLENCTHRTIRNTFAL